MNVPGDGLTTPIVGSPGGTRPVTVGLDVSPLGSPRSGIGRYAYELLGALWSVAPDGAVVPVGNRALPRGELPGRPGDTVAVSGPRCPSRAAWTFGLLPFWLPRAGIDLFHATSYYAPFTKDVPTVVTVHDLTVLAHPELHPTARVLRARAVLRRVATRAAAIIVPSEATKLDVTRLLDIPAERIHVVPGAAATCFQPLPAQAAIRMTLARFGHAPGFLLAVGTLEPRKNLARVVEALARVRLSGHPARLVVAGPAGWKYRPVLDTIRRLGLSDAVDFLGFVADDDLRALMGAAAGLVYPSLHEGFGLPVVEAMACGLPVVTSDTGALREVAEGAALLVDPTDVDSIAGGMLGLLDEAVRSRLRTAGLRRAAQFSWQRAARETLAVYRAVLERDG